MDLSGSGLLGLLTEKMAYLNKRQAVLAEDVANKDVPNFKPKDLAPFTFGDAMKQASTGMSVTDPRHIIPASLAGASGGAQKMKTYETLPSGNGVDLEQQMMLVSQTAVEYQAITSIYHKVAGWFRIATRGS